MNPERRASAAKKRASGPFQLPVHQLNTLAQMFFDQDSI